MSASTLSPLQLKIPTMRAPLLVASSAAMAAAAGLSPLLMAGPGGWVGAALCGLGTLFLTQLRDSHVEADMRSEIALERSREAPIAPTLPAVLRDIPALTIEKRGGLNLVSLRSATDLVGGHPAPALIDTPQGVLRRGDRVSFSSYDWDAGRITVFGHAEAMVASDRVQVRLDDDTSTPVLVSKLTVHGLMRRPS